MLPGKKAVNWFLVLASCICYLLLGYGVDRHESFNLLALFVLLFALYYFIIRVSTATDFRFWLITGLAVRLLFLTSVPTLSDDIFRFIWDGRLIFNDLNPFEYLPIDVVGKYQGLDQDLFNLLNSQSRPTIYPPISQFVFWISVFISPNSIMGSIITMRIILLIGELGVAFLMLVLLKRYHLPSSRVLLYVWNPLVIIEIAGNLHFEGLMVFFLLLAISLLVIKKYRYSSIAWSLAIGVKLIPLMFLPLLIRRMPFKKLLIYGSIITISTVVLFTPLLSLAFYKGMKDALALYFVEFEFNASIYYLVREIGFWQKGWNMIATIGPRLALTAFLVIMGYSWFESRRPVRMAEAIMWILLLYLSLALIVHPWYIITIVAVSIFTKWRWPIVWSGLIVLSYEGYTMFGYEENYWLIAIEYIALASFILFEFLNSNSKSSANA